MTWIAEHIRFELDRTKPSFLSGYVKLIADDDRVIDNVRVQAIDLTAETYAEAVQRLYIVPLEMADAAFATAQQHYDAIRDTPPGQLTLPRDRPPTQDEIAAQKKADDAAVFFAALYELKALQVQSQIGALPADDPSISAKAEEVKALFVPKYVQDVRFIK